MNSEKSNSIETNQTKNKFNKKDIYRIRHIDISMTIVGILSVLIAIIEVNSDILTQ